MPAAAGPNLAQAPPCSRTARRAVSLPATVSNRTAARNATCRGPGRRPETNSGYVLRNGSMKSRIQSPRMLNDMTVTRIANPGMELIHQPVER